MVTDGGCWVSRWVRDGNFPSKLLGQMGPPCSRCWGHAAFPSNEWRNGDPGDPCCPSFTGHHHVLWCHKVLRVVCLLFCFRSNPQLWSIPGRILRALEPVSSLEENVPYTPIPKRHLQKSLPDSSLISSASPSRVFFLFSLSSRILPSCQMRKMFLSRNEEMKYMPASR